MGGRGSGGNRPGSGRKPKDAHLRLVEGDTSHRPAPVVATAPVADVPMPTLPAAEAAVWTQLAPHAMTGRTLTPATAYQFELLCRNVVLERELSVGEHRGGANHRGLIQRVDAELARFCLAPMGKATYEAEDKPANPLDRFIKKAQ